MWTSKSRNHRWGGWTLTFGGHLPLVLAAHNQGLDEAAERFGELNVESNRIRRRSPFMLAQEALNASDDALWAIVSNGLTLRILRDNPSLTRPAYVEVDLETMFNEELYSDFTAFWLLTHASRFGVEGTDPSDCPWERWRNAGQMAGSRARDRLRDGVAFALRALGTGFLSHPCNIEIRDALQSRDAASSLTKQVFFEELLLLVYRLIFLATVEDRVDTATGAPLVFTPNTQADVRERYIAGYSLTMLRARAARRNSHDVHSDLWEALSITFDGLAHGEPLLGLPALGGLFEGDQCRHIGRASIENRWLLTAIFQLGYFRDATGLTRVNYRDMGPEELGSVYESLLELVPDIQNLNQPNNARFAFVGDDDAGASTKGNTRKLTGSYYTPDSLVQELIKSALEPVISQTVRTHHDRPVDALLKLTICDPACGSGHFLLAAARRLADEVAKLRAPSGAPSQADYRHALRDVVGHCIFGVDKNPMAISLAKTALWLEAYTPDLPLSFLDNHLQVGDALLGVLDPGVLENGIPDEAFSALSGDDKATASGLKKQNKADLKSWKSISGGDLFTKKGLATQSDAVEHLADDSLAGIAAKRNAWMTASAEAQQSVLARVADTYVAAFLAPKVPDEAQYIPLSGYLWGLSTGQALKPAVDEAARAICLRHGVFHWWLAFPQVFAKGGFSVMLGNPPWERIKLQEEEFFATRSPLVAMAKNKAERAKRIELLRQGLLLHTLFPDVEAAEGLFPPNKAEMLLYREFITARRGAEAASLFAHDSGRYPLAGVGDVNTYALFAETFLQLVAASGRAGFIVPTGIATDDTTKAYFEHLAVKGYLRSLLCLENEEFVFPAVHHAFRFALLTLGGEATEDASELVFFARQPEQIHDARRRFALTPQEFKLINPNTRTCPVFRSKRDAELTKKLYRAAPILVVEAARDLEGNVVEPEVNPWEVRFSTMFHMSNDSGLFRDALGENSVQKRLPLFEAKMIHQFDHRWATYIDAADKPDGLDTVDCTPTQKADVEFTARPRYWVDEREVLARIARVPARVSTAWLATHSDGARNSLEPEKTLEFAIASWVAGELFRRAAGASDSDKGWSDKVRVNAYQEAENLLELKFEDLARLLRSVGVQGKKALGEFARWARMDADVRLEDSELADIGRWHQDCCGQHVGQPRVQALLEIVDGWMDLRSPRWLMGWRDITGVEKIRTLIAAVVPRAAVGDKFLLLHSKQPALRCAALLGCLDSLVCDYIARQKVGGTSFKFFTMKQIAVLPPDSYSEGDLCFIIPRVLELTYTASDMKPWAEDLGYAGAPFGWNTTRRGQLRAELDAYYAHLYGLTRDELRYVLDPTDVLGSDYPSETFRVLRKSEVRAFGEFRVQRLVLEAWDRLAENEFSGLPYELPVSQAEESEVEVGLSQLGFIRNDAEGNFAGLVVAMLELRHGMLGAELQTAIETASMPDYVATLFNAEEMGSFQKLIDSAPGVLLSNTVARLHAILTRLENAGCVLAARQNSLVSYSLTRKTVPSDVTRSGDLELLAGFVLELDSKRQIRIAEIESRSAVDLDEEKSA